MAARSKFVLVIGAGRGLGRAIAARLAEDGCQVGVVARTENEVEQAAFAIREAGGQARALVADVLDAAALDHVVERFRAWADGPLDALVFAAGRLRAIGPFSIVDPDAWWRDAETTLRGASIAVRACLPDLRSSDSASISFLVGPGFNGPLAFAASYGFAQAGLVRLAESLAHEFEPMGIPVYAVNPGIVPTPLMDHILQSAEGRQWLPQFTEAFAEGKEVGPEVVAEMVSWLISRRPVEISGRVVAAPQTPAILETRLARIASEDLNRLRMR